MRRAEAFLRREADAALAGATAEIERIMGSRSMRLTAPLRRARSLTGGK